MEKKNLLKYIGKALFVFLLFDYSWLFQAIPILLFNLNTENLSDSVGVMLSTFSSFVLGILLFFIFKKDIKEEFKKFKEKFSFNMDVGFKYWFFGLIGMMFFNFLIGVLFNNGQSNNEESIQSMITALPWFMLVNAGFLAPWNEELVYRKALKNIFKKKWTFVLVSGLLFGLAHVIGNVEVWTDWLFVLPYGSLGVAFAASYYDTDTVFTSMAIHIIHNVVLVLLSIF